MREKKHVHFGSLSIDEFHVTLGGDAIPSIGPPIALENKAIKSSTMCLNDFEAKRPERRHLDEMKLDLWERTRLLFREGYAPGDIESAALCAEAVRVSREESQKDADPESQTNTDPAETVSPSFTFRFRKHVFGRRKQVAPAGA